MNDRERFVAVCRGERPDYVPLFGFPGAPGMSGGALKWTHRRLVKTGMPAWVGGSWEDWTCRDEDSWHRYWGTTGPIHLDFGLARGAQGIGCRRRVEGAYEILEYESGAVERQLSDNANLYTMPEFVRYPVRDRASWTFWRERTTPTGAMPAVEMEERCRRYDRRTRPLFIGVSGAYGLLRGLMGPEGLSLAMFDDPELVQEICAWHVEQTRRYVLPLVERLAPEAVYMGEDLCYNHGMLLSPAQFRGFCAPHYRAVCQAARDAGVPVVAVDSDGNVMEFADVAVELGVTCLYPSEVKAGNDLFALRRRHPQLVLVGWLEKEVINEGNEHRIEPEIMGKVPPLLEHGRYFPNGDHGIQPWATYGSLCRFMALLHEVCDNPEGEFLRERRRTPATAGANPLLRRLRAGQAQHIVTYGCSLTAGGAWVDQLRRILEQRYPGLVAITNSGQGAMWSRWGLENLEERVIAHRPDAVFIEFSMNDAFLPYDTSLEEARGNLAAMLDRIGQALPDCQAVLMVMNPPTGEHLEIRPRVEEYNQIYRDAARERGLLLIDHYPNWQRLLETEPDTFREYVPDGIHPAPLGCEKVITPAIVAALGLA